MTDTVRLSPQIQWSRWHKLLSETQSKPKISPPVRDLTWIILQNWWSRYPFNPNFNFTDVETNKETATFSKITMTETRSEHRKLLSTFCFFFWF